MKNFKRTLAAILAACAMLNLAGCSENNDMGRADDLVIGANDSGDRTNSSGSADITKPQYYPIELSENNTVNSVKLFDVISADKKNAMFSPISLNMALGLIEAGAAGDTKAAIDSYLRTENYPDLAQRYMQLAKDSYTFKGTYNNRNNVLEIANSFWADHSLPLKTDYKKLVSDKFDAEIQSVEFADKTKTLGKINGWVNEKTHKMIPSILQDYSEDTAAVLINTIYFESAWVKEWYIDKNNKEAFTLTDGTTKELPLMYKSANSYFENDGATAFSYRYMNGLDFIGILPKETGEFTLESLDIPSLLESESYDYDVDAAMPEFAFDSAFALKDVLTAAGLGIIFDEDKADFSGISDIRLWVSEILQKTRIELDKNGTKAAAVTAAVMEAGSAMPMPKETKTVRLDRPFAFMIYDKNENQILFMGKVTEP